ncbi:MAG TPA: NUDIX hydrolase [Verrucomicrobiales bacterium]|nr:NUDIX hydrolase [Verrucomicrobiales bacterium]
MIKPWPVLKSTPSGDYRIFTIRTDRRRSPRTDAEHDFFVIDCPDWVNVVAVTPDGRLVMIEQFRMGSNTVELEIPGGLIDAHDESPLAAGLRELREETGFEGTKAEILGDIFPNPAIMSNTCHTVLVHNCELKHPTEFDHGEDLLTRLVPVAEIPGLIAAGKIRHSLVVVALSYFLLRQRSLPAA